jgi:pimeloyl-ACP methyl ester carboxylesterase
MRDIARLLDDLGPAHLVGQSYGAVVVLLAAALRPKQVLSLTAIEPPVFDLARGDPMLMRPQPHQLSSGSPASAHSRPHRSASE